MLKQFKELYKDVQKAINERSHYMERVDITTELDKKCFGVGEFYFSYNDYNSNPIQFEQDF